MTKEGERREEVTFVDVTVWNRTAENCCQYLKKGQPVHIEGYLKLDTWDDKATGEKRSKLKLESERIECLGSRDGGGGEPMASYDEDADSAPREPRRSAPPAGNGANGPARRGGLAPRPRRPGAPRPRPKMKPTTISRSDP